MFGTQRFHLRPVTEPNNTPASGGNSTFTPHELLVTQEHGHSDKNQTQHPLSPILAKLAGKGVRKGGVWNDTPPASSSRLQVSVVQVLYELDQGSFFQEFVQCFSGRSQLSVPNSIAIPCPACTQGIKHRTQTPSAFAIPNPLFSLSLRYCPQFPSKIFTPNSLHCFIPLEGGQEIRLNGIDSLFCISTFVPEAQIWGSHHVALPEPPGEEPTDSPTIKK